MSIDLPDPERAAPMIPGAYERRTAGSRQPGAMGGSPFGSVTEAMAHNTMDAATIADREREGGGGPSQRPRNVQRQPRTGPALREAEDQDSSSWLTRGFRRFQILRLARR